MIPPDTFPIIATLSARRKRWDALGIPHSVPWAFLAPHEEWAKWNHSQTLTRLAECGGLWPCEMIAIVEHRRHRDMTDEEAATRLLELLAKVPT